MCRRFTLPTSRPSACLCKRHFPRTEFGKVKNQLRSCRPPHPFAAGGSARQFLAPYFRHASGRMLGIERGLGFWPSDRGLPRLLRTVAVERRDQPAVIGLGIGSNLRSAARSRPTVEHGKPVVAAMSSSRRRVRLTSPGSARETRRSRNWSPSERGGFSGRIIPASCRAHELCAGILLCRLDHKVTK
jgi:hypothetical protein